MWWKRLRDPGFLPVAGIVAIGMVVGAQPGGGPSKQGPIDRRALVTRHNPTLRAADPLSPLSLGNGEFAFTADITGLQTFPEFFERQEAGQPPRAGSTPGGSTPLVTQAQWGWHTFPNPQGYQPADAYAPYDSHGRSVEYASRRRRRRERGCARTRTA
jgi:hypothetical protein